MTQSFDFACANQAMTVENCQLVQGIQVGVQVNDLLDVDENYCL